MTNKKLGNDFEKELCEMLSEWGYWCHNMAQNAAGQPADVIAVKGKTAYLIDCKVCSNNRFISVYLRRNSLRTINTVSRFRNRRFLIMPT